MKIEWELKKWESLRDNVADVSCWFMGFEAAKGNDPDYKRPPGLKDLEDITKEINNKILDERNTK